MPFGKLSSSLPQKGFKMLKRSRVHYNEPNKCLRHPQFVLKLCWMYRDGNASKIEEGFGGFLIKSEQKSLVALLCLLRVLLAADFGL